MKTFRRTNSISSRGEKKPRMGLGASHRGGGSAPSDRAEPSRRRRPSIRRTISSFLLCGASSSSSRVMEGCPAELLVTSAEIGNGEKLKGKRKGSHLSLGTLADISTASVLCRNEIPALQTVPGNLDEVKLLSEIESGKMISCSICDGDDARASFMVEPSPDCVPATETANFDTAKGINSITSNSSRISELSNSNHIPSHCFGQSSLDEVSIGNSFAEAIDSYSDNSSSYFPDSPIAFHLMQDDNLREMMPSTAEFTLLEREQNRQEGSLLRGDLLGDSSNILSSNSVEINVLDIRNHRRSFSFSRNYVFSTDESDYSRSPDGSHRDLSDSLQGSFASLGSGSSNELGWNSRSEFWERLRGRLDTTDTPPNDCPRRTHASSSAEESVSHAISRMVVLAQTLFEVLNQIHQQPMSASLSMASLPAPESVVDSLPVKIHRKEILLECAEEISQCHICLAAYDEGDEIRVLPCQHEYHMLCVDKWLKDIHGVCPLCRGDVRKGVGESSCPNLDILPH